jgi:hypothetical protein
MTARLFPRFLIVVIFFIFGGLQSYQLYRAITGKWGSAPAQIIRTAIYTQSHDRGAWAGGEVLQYYPWVSFRYEASGTTSVSDRLREDGGFFLFDKESEAVAFLDGLKKDGLMAHYCEDDPARGVIFRQSIKNRVGVLLGFCGICAFGFCLTLLKPTTNCSN